MKKLSLHLGAELLKLTLTILGLTIVAWVLWYSGRDIRAAEAAFSKTVVAIKKSYHKDHEEAAQAFNSFQQRQLELEREVQELKEARTMERYKLTDEEFWKAVHVRDQKIEKCRDEGHYPLPTRQGWGILCVRAEAIVWSE